MHINRQQLHDHYIEHVRSKPYTGLTRFFKNIAGLFSNKHKGELAVNDFIFNHKPDDKQPETLRANEEIELAQALTKLDSHLFSKIVEPKEQKFYINATMQLVGIDPHELLKKFGEAGEFKRHQLIQHMLTNLFGKDVAAKAEQRRINDDLQRIIDTYYKEQCRPGKNQSKSSEEILAKSKLTAALQQFDPSYQIFQSLVWVANYEEDEQKDLLSLYAKANEAIRLVCSVFTPRLQQESLPANIVYEMIKRDQNNETDIVTAARDLASQVTAGQQVPQISNKNLLSHVQPTKSGNKRPMYSIAEIETILNERANSYQTITSQFPSPSQPSNNGAPTNPPPTSPPNDATPTTSHSTSHDPDEPSGAPTPYPRPSNRGHQ